MCVTFCLDPEMGDIDTDARVLTKIAKSLDVVEDLGDTVVVDVLKWVENNKQFLTELFEMEGTDDDELTEYLVCTVFPGIISGYVTADAYTELDNGMKVTEAKEVKTEVKETGDVIEENKSTK